MALLIAQLQEQRLASPEQDENFGEIAVRKIEEVEYEGFSDALQLPREFCRFKSEFSTHLKVQMTLLEVLQKNLIKTEEDIVQLRKHNQKLALKVAVLE